MLGLEPRTSSLPRKCSTTELHGRVMKVCPISSPSNVKSVPLPWAALTGASGEPTFCAKGGGVFGSPLVNLVEWVCASQPSQALRRLRQPILVPGPISTMEWTVVKVAAKRTRVDKLPDAALDIADLPRPGCAAALLQGSQVMVHGCVAHGISDAKDLHRISHALAVIGRAGVALGQRLQILLDALEGIAAVQGHRGVASALLGPSNEVLRVALNQPDAGHVFHSEYILLRSHLEAGASLAGCTVLVTRKPCRMCASIIATFLGSGRHLAVYRHDDPGPFARHSVLDAGSPDRRKWLEEFPDSAGADSDWETRIV